MLVQIVLRSPKLPFSILFLSLISALFPLLSTIFETIQPVSSIAIKPLLVHLATICIYILSLFFVFTIKIDELRKFSFFFVKWSLPISIFCLGISIKTALSAMVGASYLGGGTFLSCIGLTISILFIPSITHISQKLQYYNFISILFYLLAIFSAGKRGIIAASLPVLLLLGFRFIRFCVSSVSRLKFNYLVLAGIVISVIFVSVNISLILPSIYKLVPFLKAGHYAQGNLNLYTSSRLLEFESFMRTFDLDFYKLAFHGISLGLGIGWQFSFNPGLYTASLHNSILFMIIIIGLPFLAILGMLLFKYRYSINPVCLISKKDQALSSPICSNDERIYFYQSIFALLSFQILLISITANALVASSFCMVLFLIPLTFDVRKTT